MSNVTWNQQEESMLAYYLVNRVHDKASGRSETECINNYPRDVYFIGNLRPYREELIEQSEGDGHLREMLNKLAPMAFGTEFLLQMSEEPVEVGITVKWACYYRIFPTYRQQCIHQRQNTAHANSSTNMSNANSQETMNPSETRVQQSVIDEDIDVELGENQSADTVSSEVFVTHHDRRQVRIPQDSLFIRFRRISCSATGRIIIRTDGNRHRIVDDTELVAALSLELIRAQQISQGDVEHIQTDDNQDSKIRVPDNALTSEAAYNAFLNTLHVSVVPDWRWEVRCALRSTEKIADNILEIEFVNISIGSDNSPNTESFLFDTQATFILPSNTVKPFEIELVPRGFRYNRFVWGRGINCSIMMKSREEYSFSIFESTHVPICPQMRFSTRMDPHARFADLAHDPMSTLESILNEMVGYQQVWDQERQKYIDSNANWEAEFCEEFDKDRRNYNEEIERYRFGCDLIRTNIDVRTAFELTNEAFSHSTKTEWRLFQIVFMVSQIPGIVALTDLENSNISDREQVDIIYFPTGGGKTEAYLAMIVFHCFFDRLRGKKAGVTAWTRFPLRLLTLQQTQRVADIIGLAELVRASHHDPRLSGNNVDGFAVGYFVGQGGSPNEIVNPNSCRYPTPEEQVIWSKVNDADARQDWKRVVRCPSCRTTTIKMDFDVTSSTLIHRCTQADCRFPQGKLPIYIVDNEIYRYLPCVIVGTIDKLAGLGNQRKFTLLFGQVDGRCSHHGYYKARCCQKDCTDVRRLHRGVPSGLSGPTLFVQDELHLIKEGLGTFDGHYETFTQTLLHEFGQAHCLKIIASSATIEAFDRQVNHLYGRRANQARVFPGPGPVLGQSFYAETLQNPARLYVGVIPHNKTIFNTILEMVELYHREVQGLQKLSAGEANPYSGQIDPGTPEWRQLLDFYSTSLTYFLSNRELNSLRTDLEGDVNSNLQRDSLSPLNIFELTGSTTTDDVSRILERMESPALSGMAQDAVLATSMVSHGVDIDRFNLMIFDGMPRQNAEYIQASSRAGRSHVGIVFTCLHPVRERDQSHYAYYIKFHEFLGQLVEPVAINRWSKFSVNRTLPGLFMGVLLQLIASRSSESNPNKYYMIDFVRGKVSDGSIRPESFIPVLEDAYGVRNPTTPAEIAFHDEIHRQVCQFLDWIISPSSSLRFVSEALIPKPMTSLRDVDEAIPIELDSIGTQWTSTRTSGR